jgi:uncharacterized protein
MNQKAPTYLLDEYFYALTEKFAIHTEEMMKNYLNNMIHDFINYRQQDPAIRLLSPSEYGLELLYIGVLYISCAKKEDNTYIKQLEDIYAWLSNTKEYEEIADRLQKWIIFWKSAGSINQDFPNIIGLTNEFLQMSENGLCQYTFHASEFIRNAELDLKDREDYVFITRCINEYYINMVGAQILNQVYRKEFKQVDKVYIFVPGCMAAKMDQCKAVTGKMGYTCAKCTASCPVNQISQIGEKYHAETVIVYHGSELYHTKISSTEMSYGVIGIACVLELISGGFKAEELGYVPQCVLLNYCGCKQHWSSEGLVTDINRSRLEQLLS